MKRLLLAVGILCIMNHVSVTQAQASSTTGVKLGFNVSSFWDDSADDTEPRLGLNAGVFTQYDFLEFVGIQAELLYTQKGENFSTDSNTYTQLDYIEIPVMVRGMIPLGIVKPYLYAGAHFSVLIVGDAKWEGEDKFNWDDFNTIDWGLIFGGGVDFELGPVVLHTDLRYTLGMRSVRNSVNSKNGVFFIDVGIGF